MKESSYLKLTFVLLLVLTNSASAEDGEIQKYIFQNGRGEKIILTDSGVTIKKQFYQAKSCSRDGFICTKYGSLFALLTPLSCSIIEDYKWHVHGVTSFIIALSPHDPHDVLLSTNFGGHVSFGYTGKGGISYLFYDPKIRIGDRSVWRNIDHVDLEKVRFKKVSGKILFPCSRTE
jgi:hypothetical protein